MDTRREVALFIDLENIREGIRQAYGTELAPTLLIDKARKYGLVNIARAYADLDRVPTELLRDMQVCGISAVNAPSHSLGDRRRSAAALDLLMDLTEILLDRSGIPTVLLMSGDRDFLRVVTMARNRFGKEVIISGVPGTVSADLIDAAGGNFDPLEIPGMERTEVAEPEAARVGNGPIATYATAVTPTPTYTSSSATYSRRAGAAPAAPMPSGAPGGRYERGRGERPERYERPERSERAPRREAPKPQYGRRATRLSRGPSPTETRPKLPQPDVEEELAAAAGQGEGPIPAWQRGKLAERAEAIQRMLAERRAAGEPVPAAGFGAPGWQVGEIIEGVVKSITDFGAFLDLGGVDALLHVSQMAWQHVRHPGQIVQIGERLQVKILEIDESSGRVSVGLKQLTADPWLSAANKYEVGRTVRGRVSGVKEYGVFVELEPGIFGLLHVSNIFAQPWGHHPSERYRLDQEVEVTVSKIDPEMRRLAFVLPAGEVPGVATEGTPRTPSAEEPSAAPPSRGETTPHLASEDDEAAEAALRFREGEEEI